jgi:hypothetical protein
VGGFLRYLARRGPERTIPAVSTLESMADHISNSRFRRAYATFVKMQQVAKKPFAFYLYRRMYVEEIS